jgi:hypothetical protein
MKPLGAVCGEAQRTREPRAGRLPQTAWASAHTIPASGSCASYSRTHKFSNCLTYSFAQSTMSNAQNAEKRLLTKLLPGTPSNCSAAAQLHFLEASI